MSELTAPEWDKINEYLEKDPQRYGIPPRVYGSAVLASFNIRKLGKVSKRSANTWNFLHYVCSHFDILAVQEIMDNLEGFNKLRTLLGPDYHATVSDKTGVFPGERGLGERLGFIYNHAIVKRGDVVSDIAIDRSKLLRTMIEHYKPLLEAVNPYIEYLQAVEQWEAEGEKGKKPEAPNVKLPVFLSFIRQPFITSFRIVGHPGTSPYEVMAVNAHLYFGKSIDDRRQEFDALMNWILARVKEKETSYFPNFVLLGDLNLDFNNPETDRKRIEKHIKSFNDEMQAKGTGANVYFPFLDKHPDTQTEFRTNARLSETFDQIGFFNHDERLPSLSIHQTMGTESRGPDYGIVNFVQLFQEALDYPPIEEMSSKQKKEFFRKFEHEVSDHLPLWVRIPLPED
ncbi:MAG: endonuclease/exonuclease/phosphatase [Leptolyngbya sp. SIO3F4]|nr:endonuclease/exonuclease/phosphatase [Leptolyngbya sp. SIO3F4]